MSRAIASQLRNAAAHEPNPEQCGRLSGWVPSFSPAWRHVFTWSTGSIWFQELPTDSQRTCLLLIAEAIDV
jgi:hypothetical protein